MKMNLFKQLKNWLFPKPKKIKVIDPEGLDKRFGNNYSKSYKEYKLTYTIKEAFKYGMKFKGRRLKAWKLVFSPDNIDSRPGEYVPVYYQRRKKRSKK